MALTTQQRELFVKSIENAARGLLDLQREVDRLHDSVLAFDLLNDPEFIGLSAEKKQDLSKLFSLTKSYSLMMDGDEDIFSASDIFGGADPATWTPTGTTIPRIEMSKYVLGD